MQFKNKVAIVYCQPNEFGELTEASSKEIRCIILDQQRSEDNSNSGEKKRYDAQIVINNKGYGAYKDVMPNAKVRFRIDGVLYRARMISTIKDTSGKTKFYEVDLLEV